ncbi:methyl-accepting chemotaxis protein, partial [Rhodovulum tesquicola]|uniref:methyl-accepting chemotaxis protein n=1 Tax=Rhodovulum tesquicola TaxID=540254 RepID=UPI0020971123
MSLRAKIILSILASVALSALVVLVPMLFGMKDMIGQGTARELEQVRQRFQAALDDRNHNALSMATLVARMPQVQAAVAGGDRETLHALFVPGFADLRDKQGVRQFHFHSPDSHSFFRVNQPETFGDDLSGFRETVNLANATRAPVTGLELGRGGLAVRGIAPITHRDAHVGTIEFGLSLDEEFLRALIADSEIQMEFYVVPKTGIEAFDTSDSTTLERSVTSIDVAPLLSAARVFDARESGIEAYELTIGTEQFSGAAFPVKDFAGETVGMLHVMVPRASYLALVNKARMTALAAGAAAMILGLLGALLMGGRITATLADLIEKLKRLSDGDLQINVSAAQAAGGELGLLANGIAAFRDHRLQEVTTLAREREEAQAHRVALVEILGDGLQRLAAGDLSTPIHEDLGEGYNSVRDDYNASLESLADLIGALREAATEIHARAEEIGGASEDLSHRTENQAATLEETAAALDELTSS